MRSGVGGRQAAREDGKGGRAKINILGCSCCNKSGGNAKALLQFIIMEELTMKEIGKVLGITESRVSEIHSKAV